METAILLLAGWGLVTVIYGMSIVFGRILEMASMRREVRNLQKSLKTGTGVLVYFVRPKHRELVIGSKDDNIPDDNYSLMVPFDELAGLNLFIHCWHQPVWEIKTKEIWKQVLPGSCVIIWYFGDSDVDPVFGLRPTVEDARFGCVVFQRKSDGA